MQALNTPPNLREILFLCLQMGFFCVYIMQTENNGGFLKNSFYLLELLEVPQLCCH